MTHTDDRDAQRMAALARYQVMDSPREAAFDEIVELIAAICDVPMAVVNFIDGDRQFFKAEVGLGVDCTPLETSFCAHALLQNDFLLVADTSNDPRFACNPLVTGDPHIRFYAGALLKTADGVPIGTLCVLDQQPRTLTELQQRALRVLARQVMAQLDQRLTLQRTAIAEARQRAIVDSARDFAIVATDLDGIIAEWSQGAEAVLGWSEAEAVGASAALFFTEADRAAGVPASEMRAAREEGRAIDERWHLRKDGEQFWASGEMAPLNDEAGRHIGYVKILRDRTEQHLAGQALEEARHNLGRAQAAGGVGVFHVGADGLLHATPEFFRLYGLEASDAVPAAVFEALIIPEDRHLISTAASRGQGTVPLDVEYRIRRADTGELRWIARKGEILSDDAGVPVRFAGVARDITEARVARDALARSEERYRALFNAIDDGFCIIEFFDGPDGPLSDYVHVDANPGYERHTGIGNIVGRTVRELAPTEADDWVSVYGEVLRTGEPIRFERWFEAAGRHIEVSAARVEPASRQQVSVLFRNVEDRRRAEALARENIDRVQLALSAGAIVGTWFWDLQTDRFRVDEGFARAFGLDPALGREGLSLRQVVETVHPDDQEGLADAIAEVIARGGAYAHQYRVLRPDGRYYWIEANGRVDHAPDGTPLMFPGVLLDVEERRTVERERDRATTALRALNETLEQRVAERTAELMQAEEALRQAQKMESVGQLTGGIAHDFNNMLTGVIGSLDLIQRNLAKGRMEPVHRYIEAANTSAQRAAALTARLLAFGRRQSLDLQPADVNALVAGMADMLHRTLGEQVSLEIHPAASLWAARTDANQLESALLNLCINARDAMPGGGKLIIETTNTVLDERYVRLHHDLDAGDYVVLSVTDTGTGMAAETIEKVFEPFFTTKPVGQGTGLGLSMIYGFARQSGGHVRIYSELGQGTTVKLYLPRFNGDVEARLIDEGDAPRGAGETVLVVEDDPSVRMTVLEVLGELGYGAIEAVDAPSAIPILNSDRAIDLLVTDVGLPGMNGRQLAEVARQSRPDLKVLFVTGYAQNAAVRSGFLDAGMDMMTKPFAIEALATKLREMLGE
ncbi:MULTISPECIES: PAS domain S-box protein [unclassified Sphingomonas]|uniref:PAS domain S-box protein n=1 Tax=unclassified Sphingomonas TaxID=196159 RepID=UPI0022698512|nr:MULTISPECIES: PAS domain S-box protein [unclassified Sphingomonas]